MHSGTDATSRETLLISEFNLIDNDHIGGSYGTCHIAPTTFGSKSRVLDRQFTWLIIIIWTALAILLAFVLSGYVLGTG